MRQLICRVASSSSMHAACQSPLHRSCQKSRLPVWYAANPALCYAVDAKSPQRMLGLAAFT